MHGVVAAVRGALLGVAGVGGALALAATGAFFLGGLGLAFARVLSVGGHDPWGLPARTIVVGSAGAGALAGATYGAAAMSVTVRGPAAGRRLGAVVALAALAAAGTWLSPLPGAGGPVAGLGALVGAAAVAGAALLATPAAGGPG